MATSLPALPSVFKSLQHYIQISGQLEQHDPVVSYYCRIYALERGMQIDRKSPEARNYLTALMDSLETMKTSIADNEAVKNEVVGQAHMEDYALKLFHNADTEDRAGHFSKKLVKTFYMASKLMDVLTNFGELSDDVEHNRKYAAWKATYIHKCLQDGVTPVAGPLDGESDPGGAAGGFPSQPQMPQPGPSTYPPPPSSYQPPPSSYQPPPQGSTGLAPNPGVVAPPTTPSDPPGASVGAKAPQPAPTSTRYQQPANPYGVSLCPEDYQRAMKLCKYAGSALQYEDSKTAIDNLTKALNLLTSGKE